MKCQAGDIAVLIEDPSFKESGLFVDVLRLDEECADSWVCARRDGGLLWTWELVGLGVVPRLVKECGIPDAWLQPIRGLPLVSAADISKPVEDIAHA